MREGEFIIAFVHVTENGIALCPGWCGGMRGHAMSFIQDIVWLLFLTSIVSYRIFLGLVGKMSSSVMGRKMVHIYNLIKDLKDSILNHLSFNTNNSKFSNHVTVSLGCNFVPLLFVSHPTMFMLT